MALGPCDVGRRGLGEEAIVWRKVKDVMTGDVATAREHTPYKELVRLLAERRISALPVVDADQQVIGIVSEGDLLAKQDHPVGTVQRLMGKGKRGLAGAKAQASTAGELMSRPAITVGSEATVAEAVRLLRTHLVKRLPVTDSGGRLVGIVNRSDLLGVFLRPDEEIRQEVVEEIIFSRFGLGPDRFKVTVCEGVVGLEGRCPRGLIPAVVRAVAAVEGVVRVENRLGYDLDDTAALLPAARSSDTDSLWMDLE
jgi:CBS-domain-containing membrane protein